MSASHELAAQRDERSARRGLHELLGTSSWQRTARVAAWVAMTLGVSALASPTARASTTLAGDLDAQIPVSVDGVGTGGGFGIRLGTQLHVPLLSINPEIGFTYAQFSKEYPPQVYRGIVGLRVGLGELLRIGVLAHFGFGYVSWDRGYLSSSDRADLTHSGTTYDIGGFFEVTALPLLNIGVHAVYNRIADDHDQPDPLHWLQLGVHAALVL